MVQNLDFGQGAANSNSRCSNIDSEELSGTVGKSPVGMGPEEEEGFRELLASLHMGQSSLLLFFWVDGAEKKIRKKIKNSKKKNPK